MSELLSRIEKIQTAIDEALESSSLKSAASKKQLLEKELAQQDAWNDVQVAQDKSRELGKVTQIISPWLDLKAQLDELLELQNLGDESLAPEIMKQLEQVEKSYQELHKMLLFDGTYDSHDAILRLQAGAGGTDAQDWAEMLERMYLRWAEKGDYKTELIEKSSGEEAGIKSASLSISGPFAYGKLKGEHGVHRLVRLSPFNADAKRQTSFAMVEVLPAIDQPDEVELDEKDLKIDVYRSGGSGGQSVNTTDSAVRVTHLPTGISVAIQNERSQLQNKETALKIIRSRLAQLSQEQHTEKVSELKGPNQEAAWGNQIRNYVLHPYTMVKDTRTKHEETDASGVLDGKIDGFIETYLARSTS